MQHTLTIDVAFLSFFLHSGRRYPPRAPAAGGLALGGRASPLSRSDVRFHLHRPVVSFTPRPAFKTRLYQRHDATIHLLRLCDAHSSLPAVAPSILPICYHNLLPTEGLFLWARVDVLLSPSSPGKHSQEESREVRPDGLKHTSPFLPLTVPPLLQHPSQARTLWLASSSHLTPHMPSGKHTELLMSPHPFDTDSCICRFIPILTLSPLHPHSFAPLIASPPAPGQPPPAGVDCTYT